MKRLVLLGGGHAHVHVLQAMAREHLPGVQALLVTPFVRQMYSGMVPGLVAGHYTADECAIPLLPLAQAARVPLLEVSATRIDAAARCVHLSDGRVAEYDVLSVDTGAVMHRDVIAGAREHGLFVRPIEHFVVLFEGLLALANQRVLDVVVIGGGAAGVELAMALQWRLARAEDGRDERARIALVTGGPPPLAGYPEAVMARAAQALRRQRITVLPEVCAAIAADHVLLANGARVVCDAPLLAIGAQAPKWLADSGLTLDERGFIVTGPSMQSVSHAEVFAVGDVASRADAPHAKSGVHAVRAGAPLAANLRLALAGGELQRYMPPKRTLNLVSCGRREAIASYGEWSTQGRWVWWLKDRIDRAFVRRYSMAGSVASSTIPGA